jgi:ABC-type transporter MlaC component
MENFMKTKKILTAVAILFLQSFASADSNVKSEEASVELVKTFFKNASLAAGALSDDKLLNGTESQEGVCRIARESIDFDYVAPRVAGKEIWSPATVEQRIAFNKTLITKLAIFIGVGFKNYANGLTPQFSIKPPQSGDSEKTKSKTTMVKIILPGQDTDITAKTLISADGTYKVYDFILSGVSTVQNLRTDFAGTSSASIEALTSKIRAANNNSGYGKCDFE